MPDTERRTLAAVSRCNSRAGEVPDRAGAQSGHVHPRGRRSAGERQRAMSDMADHAMSGPMDENMMKHMELTPSRPATHDDSVRAHAGRRRAQTAIAKYQDTAVAVADGYKMFLPNVKKQKRLSLHQQRPRVHGSVSLRRREADVACSTSAAPTASCTSSARCTRMPKNASPSGSTTAFR